ncbi:hypothetical protein cyc_02006 [Cyclospora cayetanensis]|uniref:Uncharacterized protein n=1 Tax=Cyclospora cayetanensis TaxID=88456 RepID=A0A1D3D5I7_9EIME|nr:hypothetical protein cyc_02006 [Cyclospora cayetanensis]
MVEPAAEKCSSNSTTPDRAGAPLIWIYLSLELKQALFKADWKYAMIKFSGKYDLVASGVTAAAIPQVYGLPSNSGELRRQAMCRIEKTNLHLGGRNRRSAARLKANLSKHGDIRVHMFVPATEYGAGWAWVTCEKHDEVEKMLAFAEERRAQAAAALRENIQKSANTKDDEDAASAAAAETSADDAKCSESSGELSDE